MTIAVLIVAAGCSSRMGEGSALPKPYLPLGGKTVLRHSIEAFLKHAAITSVTCVIHPDHQSYYQEAVKGLELPAPVFGGATRTISVANGLESLNADYVLIHDAARPFVKEAAISRVIAALEGGAKGVIPVIPVSDSLRKNGVPEDRNAYSAIQTPQGFTLRELQAAYASLDRNDISDDAQVLEAAGHKIHEVAGDTRTFKITYRDDYERANSMIAGQYITVTGQGFDVHRFTEGDHVILGGVKIPHTHRLEGHSDADVVLHAITDAVLGAIGEGDIGQHFPPSDSRWRGADSSLFLTEALNLLRISGGRLLHIDVTLICEAPKVGPHRENIRANIAALAKMSLQRVNIKATTTEKLGFTGRGEGIAAQAIVSVALPDTDGDGDGEAAA
ncbi:MAG: bifunctional 2-C-methyl-D-erythritol 4-phosphate cytidylyltransferase/2-C-methyl-D-erythritol 2,4-cyclodiphosphate synthase [Pseudobdellovibrionaceae bacterium]